MSLISDALKKARQEAARQDALRPGVPYALGKTESPVRRSPWMSLLAGLGAGCLLAGVVFALAWFAGWGPFHKPAAETRVAAAPALPSAPAPLVVPQPVAAPPIPVSPPAAPPQARPETPATSTAPPREPVRRELEAPRSIPQLQELPARRPAQEAAPPAAPAPAPPAEPERPVAAPVQTAPAPATPSPTAGDSGSLEDGKVYVGEVPVPGGGKVRLNGIAFSQDQPVAVLDGRVMGPGESIGGFTIVAIESGRVKLQGHGATVFLSPK